MKKVNLGTLRGMSLARAIQYAASYGYKIRVLSNDGRPQGRMKAEAKQPDRINIHVNRNHVTSVVGVY